MLRYSVQIKFNGSPCTWPVSYWDIFEDFKTLAEAQRFKPLIDSSVKRARVVDNVNNKVVDVWKGY